jgi:hypothetical protein
MQKMHPKEFLREKLKSLDDLAHLHNPNKMAMDIVENSLMYKSKTVLYILIGLCI